MLDPISDNQIATFEDFAIDQFQVYLLLHLTKVRAAISLRRSEMFIAPKYLNQSSSFRSETGRAPTGAQEGFRVAGSINVSPLTR